MTETTPQELCRQLGVEECVEPLVELARLTDSRSLLTDIIRLAVALGARGLTCYQERVGLYEDPEQRAELLARIKSQLYA